MLRFEGSLEEDVVEDWVAFFCDKNAHLRAFPALPEIIEGNYNRTLWDSIRTWAEIHRSVSAGTPANGIKFQNTPCALPKSIRLGMLAEMGFGAGVPWNGRGPEKEFIMEILEEVFPVHHDLNNENNDNRPGSWNTMVYVFFHIPTGKLYVGKFNRTGETWIQRTYEHFVDALKKPLGDGTPPTMCWAIRTSELTDWKIFALRQCQGSQVRALEGYWIRTLDSLAPRGFNGNLTSYCVDPLVSANPVISTFYAERVKQALKLHRELLKVEDISAEDLVCSVDDVERAFQNLCEQLETRNLAEADEN